MEGRAEAEVASEKVGEVESHVGDGGWVERGRGRLLAPELGAILLHASHVLQPILAAKVGNSTLRYP